MERKIIWARYRLMLKYWLMWVKKTDAEWDVTAHHVQNGYFERVSELLDLMLLLDMLKLKDAESIADNLIHVNVWGLNGYYNKEYLQK